MAELGLRAGLQGQNSSIRRRPLRPLRAAERSSEVVEPRTATRRQQLQHVAVLLPRSGHDAEHPREQILHSPVDDSLESSYGVSLPFLSRSRND